MGGGYAKLSAGVQSDADGNPIQSEVDDEEETTPRTENEEIAKQAEESRSRNNSTTAPKGPPSASGNGKISKYAKQKIRWADMEKDGPPLVEPFYSDKLHYSVLFDDQ